MTNFIITIQPLQAGGMKRKAIVMPEKNSFVLKSTLGVIRVYKDQFSKLVESKLYTI